MIAEKVHSLLTDDSVDTPPGEAARFMRHLVAMIGTKIGDGLIDPKLVLAWIMSAGGAPGYLVGALVPVRESGALLPQLALARQIQARKVRKYFWAGGALIMGLCALCMALATATLSGAALGWALIVALAVLALARASCSASYKDVVARTLETGTRGTVSGAAGTAAAAVVFGFAAFLAIGLLPLTVSALAVALAVAGALFLVAGVVFAGLSEPADTRAASSEGQSLREMFAPLRKDAALRRFITARGLLTATALAPPFLVMLAGQGGGSGLGQLGLLMLASSLAAIASSYVWGRLSDRSSRATLIWAGLLSATALGTAALIGLRTGGLGPAWAAPAVLFIAQIGYEGVRAGRKTHLTDMETGGQKALYTALSNTVIGVLLLAGGAFGLMADAYGAASVLAIFAGMSVAGALVASRLPDVQKAAPQGDGP